MRRLNDIFGAVGPHSMERMSVVALAQLPKIAARAKTMLESNRATLNEFFDGRDDVAEPAAGGQPLQAPGENRSEDRNGRGWAIQPVGSTGCPNLA